VAVQLRWRVVEDLAQGDVAVAQPGLSVAVALRRVLATPSARTGCDALAVMVVGLSVSVGMSVPLEWSGGQVSSPNTSAT